LKLEDSHGQERLISAKFMCPYDGFSFPEVEPRLFSFNSPYGACPSCNGLGTKHYFGDEQCESCNGARLRAEALHVFLGGDAEANGSEAKEKRGMNIVESTSLSIEDAYEFFSSLRLSKQDQEVCGQKFGPFPSCTSGESLSSPPAPGSPVVKSLPFASIGVHSRLQK
ncbi:MAG: hypothetical protein C4520_20995, partial [Candidatus Abyssobacteria bacterium SURF_5]